MPEFGRAIATFRDSDHLDVFMKSPEGTLIHTWTLDNPDDLFDNAIDLGGDLDSEPVAIRRFPMGMEVFARSTRQTVLHWSWDVTAGLWSGPEELPGLVATDVKAVADDDALYVFATSVDGVIRWWMRPASGAWQSKDLIWSENLIIGDPVVVRHDPGQVDVYVNTKQSGVDSTTIERYSIVNGGWERQKPLRIFHNIPLFKLFDRRIAAFSWGPGRQDVFVRGQRIMPGGALGHDGVPVHWGRGFLATTDTDDGWFGPEIVGPAGAILDFDPTVVARSAGDADMFFRDNQLNLHHWGWKGTPDRTWNDLGLLNGKFPTDPSIVSRNKDTVEIVQRTGDYTVQMWRWQNGVWARDSWKANLYKPDPPQDALAGSTDDDPPEYVIIRPDDHVVLGLNAPSYDFVEGAEPQLVDGDGRLVVTFPPQHIAEEVSRPGNNPARGYWLALLSGPSRVALRADSDLSMTAAGVLAALDDQPVDGDQERSAIELPRGLIVAPESPAPGRQAVIRHPTAPVGSVDADGTPGAVGLWRTRFGTADGDGGLHVRGLRAGREDGFAVALPKADRVLIAEQNTPAQADRLELSCLGGTLTASGKWDTFEWDHRAVLVETTPSALRSRACSIPLDTGQFGSR